MREREGEMRKVSKKEKYIRTMEKKLARQMDREREREREKS